MTDTRLPFEPFSPATPAATPAVSEQGKKPRKKSSSKKKSAASATPAVQPVAEAPAATPPAPRQRRKAASQKRGPRFELQTILKIASDLKLDDMPTFENALDLLHGTPKAARTRIMAALGKVLT